MKNPIEVIKKAQDKGAPVFVLVGTDLLALDAIMNYSDNVDASKEVSEKFKKEIEKIKWDFCDFADDRPELVKYPD